MENKQDISDKFEIICNEKTYTSKKMNPVRRALIIKNIIGRMNSKTANENVDTGVSSMGELFEKNLPETMWAFVKEEDKTQIGTMAEFVEELDDKNCIQFLKWAIDKVNEVNDFLAQGKVETEQASV